MTEPVKFLCTIPQKADAIKVHGDDGGRLVLEIPETELGKFATTILLRKKVLECTLEEVDH